MPNSRFLEPLRKPSREIGFTEGVGHTAPARQFDGPVQRNKPVATYKTAPLPSTANARRELLSQRPELLGVGCKPLRVEPAVGGTVVRQARDIPMADKGRINIPDRGTAANKDNAACKALEQLPRTHA
jgi:hypothetical protein